MKTNKPLTAAQLLTDYGPILMRACAGAVLGAERDIANPKCSANIKRMAQADVAAYWEAHALIYPLHDPEGHRARQAHEAYYKRLELTELANAYCRAN